MKIKEITIFSVFVFFCIQLSGQSVHDKNEPFGMAVRTSLNSGTEEFRVTGGGAKDYPVTGVDAGKVTIMKSTGKDMYNEVHRALSDYDVIVFDGSAGDFILSRAVPMSNLSGKTLLGINGARLCTEWYITDEVKQRLDDAGVLSMSGSAGTGGYLSNGVYVSEEQEQHTRQTLIDMFGNEDYRNAGILRMSKCKNIIVRNLKFVGPGSVDVGGTDLLQMTGSKNVWVDHCEFTDGIDGNFDITMQSDFVTVSWCTFSYTERSYSHSYSNLVCSAEESPADAGLLNVTFACNVWGEGCSARMPMARYGTFHIVNNYYNCPGNSSPCIQARNKSTMLIENNYFAYDVKRCFSESNATAYESRGNIAVNPYSQYMPSTKGNVAMPYGYTPLVASDVPEEVGRHAGATLFRNVTGVSNISVNKKPSSKRFNAAGLPVGKNAPGVIISNGRKTLEG